MSGRWRVESAAPNPSPYKWLALAPHPRDLDGLHGPTCDCHPFRSFAEAIAYADGMARAWAFQERVIDPNRRPGGAS